MHHLQKLESFKSFAKVHDFQVLHHLKGKRFLVLHHLERFHVSNNLQKFRSFKSFTKSQKFLVISKVSSRLQRLKSFRSFTKRLKKLSDSQRFKSIEVSYLLPRLILPVSTRERFSKGSLRFRLFLVV